MSYLLALDQGTTSSRALLFRTDGTLVAQHQEALDVAYPQPGWVEQDSRAILDTQLRCAHEALAAVPAGEKVAALGIANQRETTILWDRASGEALGPAIVWQDRRTAAHCERLRQAGAEALVKERTGLLLDPYFCATKIAWLMDHVPDARRRAQSGELAFGTVESWLLWHLSGGQTHATDASNAARTLLFDIHKQRWDPELLELFDVPESLLPEVRSNTADFGTVRIDDTQVCVHGMAGDQHAALFAQACLTPGQAKATYGTGAFVLVNTGTAVAAEGLLTTLAWRLRDAEPVYALEGSVFNAGAVVQWVRDGLGLIDKSAEIEALAAATQDSDGVWLVPALTGLGAPYWRPQARGAILGLTRATTDAHIARATLEAIAFRVCDVVRAVNAATDRPVSEIRVDGGASRNNLLMQMQADALGTPLQRPHQTEITAMGAALLAGIGASVLNEDAPQRWWRCERQFEPQSERSEREARYAVWQKLCKQVADLSEGLQA
ncbi:MAG: glycerol kinase GlpK [Gammaproteobacteria bacterium]